MYRTPFHKIAHGEWYLGEDIDEYNPDQIVLEEAHNLTPGNEILIIGSSFSPPIKERHIVATIVDDYTFTVVDPIFTNFPAGEETRICRIGYDPAIVLISSRKSAANIFDKYFASQASPDVSDYGNKLRDIAMSQISDILNGTVILYGSERIGNRFANANLYDRYSLISRDGNDSKELKKQ